MSQEFPSLFKMLSSNSERPFERKLISKYLILIKYSKDEATKKDLKLKIFLAASKLFVKAINNFFSLIQMLPEEKKLHTNEDIACECYLVLVTCIEKVELKNVKKFYFYLNTSLNRRMFRIYDRVYKKHLILINNTNENVAMSENRGFLDHFDLTEIDLSDFNELELRIIKFKFSGEKLNVFLRKAKMTSLDYYRVLENIKVKLYQRYQEK